MIVTFLRSSSYNTYDFCQRKYFIDYVLGWRSPSNVKAEKGTIVHKMLELTARMKLAIQNDQIEVNDDEIGTFKIEELTYDFISQIVFQKLSPKTQTLYNWSDKDFKEVRKWYLSAIDYNNGMFNPINQEIVCPEKYFNLTIEKPWSYYEYKMPDGQVLTGFLGLKGTLDLIVRIDGNTLELVDYKTGKRMDWNTGEEKTLEKLYQDPQLRMYHYALCQLFPEIENFIITIFYINDGGAFSMNYTREELDETENMLKKRFIHIRNNFKPKRIYPNWKCTKLCHFGKNDMSEQPSDYKNSICAKMGEELLTLGMDKVIDKHTKSSITSYGSGGGTTRE